MFITHDEANITMHVKGISRVAAVIAIIVIIIVAGGGGYYYYSTTISHTTTPTKKLSGSITIAADPGYNDAALKQIAQNFMAANPGTTITIAEVPYADIVSSEEPSLALNQSPYSIITLPAQDLGPLEPSLLNLAPYLSNPAYFPASWNYSDILPSEFQLYTSGQSIYAIPEATGVMDFFYRPSLFDNSTNQQLFLQQYGYALPNPGNTTLTLSQLVDLANFFNGQHGSKYGIVLMSDSGDDDIIQTYMALLAGTRVGADGQFGPVKAPYGELFSSSGVPIFNTSAVESTLNSYIQLVRASESPLSAAYETVPEMFGSGGVAMMVFWETPALYLNNASRSNIVGDWALAPTFPTGHTLISGTGLAINAHTTNLPLALAFLEYATSPSQSVYLFSMDSLLPFRESVFNYAMQHNPTYAQSYLAIEDNIAQGVMGIPDVSYLSQMATYFNSQIAYIYNNQTTIPSAMNSVQAQTYSLINGAT